MAGLNFPAFSTTQGCTMALEISSDLGFCEISVSDLIAIISSSPLGCGKMEGLGHADLRSLLKPSGSVNTVKGRGLPVRSVLPLSGVCSELGECCF